MSKKPARRSPPYQSSRTVNDTKRTPAAPAPRRRRRAPRAPAPSGGPVTEAQEAQALTRRIAELMEERRFPYALARKRARFERNSPDADQASMRQREARRMFAELYAALRRVYGDGSASWRDHLCRCAKNPGGLCDKVNIHSRVIGWLNCPFREDLSPEEKARWDAVGARLRPHLIAACSPDRRG